MEPVIIALRIMRFPSLRVAVAQSMRVENVKAVTSINNICDGGGGTVAKASVTVSGGRGCKLLSFYTSTLLLVRVSQNLNETLLYLIIFAFICH